MPPMNIMADCLLVSFVICVCVCVCVGEGVLRLYLSVEYMWKVCWNEKGPPDSLVIFR